MVNSSTSTPYGVVSRGLAAAVLQGLCLLLVSLAVFAVPAPVLAAGRPALAPPGVIIEPAPPPQEAPGDDEESGDDNSERRGLGCPANQAPLELLV